MNVNSTAQDFSAAEASIAALSAAVAESCVALRRFTDSLRAVDLAFADCIAAYSPSNPLRASHKRFSVTVREFSDPTSSPSSAAAAAAKATIGTFERLMNEDCVQPLHTAAAHIRNAARARHDLIKASDYSEAQQRSLEKLEQSYEAKGKAAAESTKWSEKKTEATQAVASYGAARSAFEESLASALRAKETALSRCLRGLGEHIGGITTVLGDAFNGVFQSAPIPTAAGTRVTNVRASSPVIQGGGTPLSARPQRGADRTSSPPREKLVYTPTAASNSSFNRQRSPPGSPGSPNRHNSSNSGMLGRSAGVARNASGSFRSVVSPPMPAFMRHSHA